MRILWLSEDPSSDTISGRASALLCPALQVCGHEVYWVAFGLGRPAMLWLSVEVHPFFEGYNDECSSADVLDHYLAKLHPDVLISFGELYRFDFLAGMDLNTRTLRWVNWFTLAQEEDNEPLLTSLLAKADLNFTWCDDVLDAVRERNPSVSVLPIPDAAVQPKEADGPGAGLHAERLDKCILAVLPMLIRVEETIASPVAVQDSSALVHGDVRINLKYHVFSNSSFSHTMQELTYALHTVGADVSVEPAFGPFAKSWFRDEEAVYREQNPGRHEVIRSLIEKRTDPARYVHVEHILTSSDSRRQRYCHQTGSILSLRGTNVLYSTGNHTLGRDQARSLLRAYAAVWVPSHHLAKAYLEAGFPEDRLFVIPHGIDEALFNPDVAPASVDTDRGFSFLQWSFPWLHEKGFDVALDAFCAEFTARDDVALILKSPYCEGHTEKLVALVEEHRSKSDAPGILLDTSDIPLPERPGFYTACDCYVHPTRAEGFGMTMLEAMACGLPVIATDWSGHTDFCTDQNSYPLKHKEITPARTDSGAVTRYFAEPDVEHLRELMRHVFENREEAKQKGIRASWEARKDWTWTAAAYKIINAIHDLGLSR